MKNQDLRVKQFQEMMEAGGTCGEGAEVNVIEGKQFKKPRAWRDASLGIGRSERGRDREQPG